MVRPLSFKVPGQVQSVLVDDNQKVKKGDLLVEIDPRDYQVRLDEARAEPDINFMLQPHDGRLFLISNLDQDKLELRYKLWAWAHFVIFFGALGGITWILQHYPL